MRAWVIVAVVFVAVVVLWDILSLVGLLAGLITGLLLPDDPDKLPSNIMVGHTVGPFPWGALIVQFGLGLVAVAFLFYVFRRRRRT